MTRRITPLLTIKDLSAFAYPLDDKDKPRFSLKGLAGACDAWGPVGVGTDDSLWSYADGVWQRDPHVVRDRTACLLGDAFKQVHASNAETYLKARSVDKRRVIEGNPVPEYINVANGLLDWRTGTLHAHRAEVLSTVQLPVEYDPEATCPTFVKWLADVVPADCIDLMFELIGYLAYSGNPLHSAVMLVGSGRNGKSTFLDVMKALLGGGNVSSVSLASLTGNRFAPAQLHGKLANLAGDIDATYLAETAMFKAITGGDTIMAEHKHGQPFEFTPWAVPVFSANRVPASADVTAGYLSRWLVIPFPNSFAGREDRFLAQRLKAELPGILAEGVRRLPGLLDRGQFSQVDSATDAKAEFSRRVDQVRYWLHVATEPHTESFVAHTDAYMAYQQSCMRDGGKAVGAREFGERLASAGYRSSQQSQIRGATRVSVRGYRGFKLVNPDVTMAVALPRRYFLCQPRIQRIQKSHTCRFSNLDV
jgi:putative DNA primase/helicase